jgi:AcrR family transcriptional regulator
MRDYLDELQRTRIDPRVVRTRRLLLDSFESLLDEHKAIRAISVQSITEHAGVNRATFYAHFSDKYELMSEWKRDLFRQSLNDKLLDKNNVEAISFEQLIETVLEFSISYRRYFRHVNKQYEPLFEAAMQQEMKTALLLMLENMSPKDLSLSPQDMATFLSWAIFGSANEWSREPNGVSKRVMAEQLLLLVQKMIHS